jgi:hypothetical protein
MLSELSPCHAVAFWRKGLTAVYKFNHALHFARTERIVTISDGPLTVVSNARYRPTENRVLNALLANGADGSRVT